MPSVPCWKNLRYAEPVHPRLFDESTDDLLPRDGRASLHLDVLSPERGEAIFEALRKEVPWAQHDITIFGRTVAEPRLSAWVGDEGTDYTYSGRPRAPLPWTPALSEMRMLCEEVARSPFNAVLCNLYRDGQDSMGWHSDDETDLGANPVIASLSLGSERRFRFRPRETRETITLDLPPRSLLVMAGECQRHWQHAISKTTRDVGPRINLTYRQVKPRD